MKILILNGPNLNRLGKREPGVYGNWTMDMCLEHLRKEFPNVEFEYFQSNCEGALIDRLQTADEAGDVAGVVLNAGAYAHTSVALADCLHDICLPVVEVHISNIYAREDFRRHSLISEACAGIVCGFGMKSYELAVRGLC